MSRITLAALLALLCLPRPAAADLDAETNKPYELRVVLHAEEHRALTKNFQEQLERELTALLQRSFGPLVNVRVEPWQAADQPILKEIERRGLQQALEGWVSSLKGKTHFLLLRFAADRYEIRSRQFDHTTGMCTGTEHRAEVADRRLVARQAAALVEQDFGVVGTVVGDPKGREVEVAIQGGALGVSLKDWVKLGDVLTVVRVLQGRGHGEPIPWVLLRVTGEKGNGVYQCQLSQRYGGDPLAKAPGVLGYRCLRMAATQVPLRLRLLDEKSGQPLDGVSVEVRRADSTEGEAEKIVPRNGLVVTHEVYDRAAFVRVMVSGIQKAQIPVLLLDERVVVCPVEISTDPEAQRRSRLRDQSDFWVRRILDGLAAADERVRELNRQRNSDPENTLALARKGYQALTDDLANLKLLRNELRKADAKQLDLNDGERLMAALQKRGEELQKYIENLDQALKEAKGERAQKLKADYAKARLLETQAEYQEALDLYNAMLKDNPQETNVLKDRDRLAKAWQLRGPDHEQARTFIYETWPKLDLAGLQSEMKKADKALKDCKKAGDRLTPRKMLLASVTHAANLKKRLEAARRLDSEEGRAEAKRLVQLGEEFRALLTELTAYVGKE
jgi:tetratricopeptide (TPR) repeat protein